MLGTVERVIVYEDDMSHLAKSQVADKLDMLAIKKNQVLFGTTNKGVLVKVKPA